METNEMALLEAEKERNPFILGNTVEICRLYRTII